MSRIALLLSLLLLASCTGAIRASTPAELVGARSARTSNFRMSLEEDADESITDPCHYQLLLKNAILEERLKHCKPDTPEPEAKAKANVDLDIAPIRLKLVPADEKTETEPEASLPSDFPPPMGRNEMRTVSLMPVVCPPPPK